MFAVDKVAVAVALVGDDALASGIVVAVVPPVRVDTPENRHQPVVVGTILQQSEVAINGREKIIDKKIFITWLQTVKPPQLLHAASVGAIIQV